MLRFPYLVLPLMILGSLAGCATPATELAEAEQQSQEFRVPDIRVGDAFRYGFGYKTSGFEAAGVTDVRILERAPMMDGAGQVRDALHVLQSSPEGDFGETYWVDAETLTQFKRERTINYTEVTRFPTASLQQVPMRRASYGNGTGTEELFKEDPLFEDYSFFGGFASGRTIAPVGGELGIPGYFWLRDQTLRLAVYENLTGRVSKHSDDETWGSLRHVEFNVEWRVRDDFETLHWIGSFSAHVPLATQALRHIKAQIGSQRIDVTFNATLLAYEPGSGEALQRTKEQVEPTRRSVEFAAWDRAPADGSGVRLLFPLSEALAALDRDPTAAQYFQQHPGSYLQVAHLDEIDTCGFYAQGSAPGCHWYDWQGRFVAPDGYALDFRLEKFADAAGGPPAYVPYVSREYPFEVIFNIGGTPQAPRQPVVVTKNAPDYPPRSQRAADSMTVAGAVAAWRATAWNNLTGLEPNRLVLYITDAGYAYYIVNEQWVFPPQNPEFTFFYDEGPLVLERHMASMDANGLVLESRNYHTQVTHR